MATAPPTPSASPAPVPTASSNVVLSLIGGDLHQPNATVTVVAQLEPAGAYGAVMASSYNTRPLVPEVMVDGTRFAVIRARPTIEEMLSTERFPPWMETKAQ